MAEAEDPPPPVSFDADVSMHDVEPVKPIEIVASVEPVLDSAVDSPATHESSNGLTNGHSLETHSHTFSPSPAAISPPVVPTSETALNNLAAAPSPYPNNTISNEHVHDQPPPAKRARKYSDAEQASLANVSLVFFRAPHRRADVAVSHSRPAPLLQFRLQRLQHQMAMLLWLQPLYRWQPDLSRSVYNSGSSARQWSAR